MKSRSLILICLVVAAIASCTALLCRRFVCSHQAPTSITSYDTGRGSTLAMPSVFTNSAGLVLIMMRPGKVTMGSAKQERTWALAHGGYREWLDWETNPTTVSLTYAYLIAKTEVTVAQYKHFTQSTDYKADAYRGNLPLTWDSSKQGWRRQKGRTWENPTLEQGDQHPVICLTWNDANTFCEWLTRTERDAQLIADGQQYRLPTEAEWQYACLGNSSARYAWGDAVSNAFLHANVIDATPQPDGSVTRVPHFPWKDGHFFTAPVASFNPTEHGLFDIHGNAWEWCHNWYYPYPGGTETNPTGPERGKQRVMRGGSWDNYTATFRANSRRVVRSNFSSDTTGFRIVLVSEL